MKKKEASSQSQATMDQSIETTELATNCPTSPVDIPRLPNIDTGNQAHGPQQLYPSIGEVPQQYNPNVSSLNLGFETAGLAGEELGDFHPDLTGTCTDNNPHGMHSQLLPTPPTDAADILARPPPGPPPSGSYYSHTSGPSPQSPTHTPHSHDYHGPESHHQHFSPRAVSKSTMISPRHPPFPTIPQQPPCAYSPPPTTVFGSSYFCAGSPRMPTHSPYQNRSRKPHLQHCQPSNHEWTPWPDRCRRSSNHECVSFSYQCMGNYSNQRPPCSCLPGSGPASYQLPQPNGRCHPHNPYADRAPTYHPWTGLGESTPAGYGPWQAARGAGAIDPDMDAALPLSTKRDCCCGRC
ncbi:uncharacterized protein EI97DRAFT_145038 [Westerdykella ornata]|uniref:Uncharacterized protein n=1 Tax=Westerdykella ornata TaxID=318751 RepID=A0A6A6JC61_WESOR|nr:uncharacterized protein EI97DRAFT_145038 [Westerdykella ornata]KAF2273804.1 hypothetical protein EI97DRAFT_145038 [Westerdykella ornata]